MHQLMGRWIIGWHRRTIDRIGIVQSRLRRRFDATIVEEASLFLNDKLRIAIGTRTKPVTRTSTGSKDANGEHSNMDETPMFHAVSLFLGESSAVHAHQREKQAGE